MVSDEILEFWFADVDPRDWWRKDPAFDTLIARRFGDVHAAAVRGELFSWRLHGRGRLAEIVVLDQFSRNIHRDTPGAFAADAMALALAQEAVAQGADGDLSAPEQAFLFMPYMHSESRLIHREALHLFSRPGLERNLDAEVRHKRIIDRFGRYPHRNAILGRVSTEEEEAFLRQPGSAF